MSVRKLLAERSVSAAKVLVAACGVAGCTGTPTVATVSPETPTALIQPDHPVQVVQIGTPRSATTERIIASAAPHRPVLNEPDRRAAPATRDPFAARAQAAQSRAAVAGTAQAPTAATRTAATRTASVRPAVANDVHKRVQRVGHFEAGGTARSVASARQPSVDTLGVTRVQDHRLPPAAPLGSTNPFDLRASTTSPGATPTMSRAAASASRVAKRPAPRVVQRPVARPSVDFTPVSAEQFNASGPDDSPVPIAAFLAGDRLLGEEESPAVENEDMIVDSVLLSKRNEWRDETLPQRRTSGRSPYPIMPRRPFASPEWETSTPQAASANLPISISPAETFATSRREIPASPAVETETGTPRAAAIPVKLTKEVAGPKSAAQDSLRTEPFSEFEAQFAAEAAPPADDADVPDVPDVASAPLLAPMAPPPPMDPEVDAIASAAPVSPEQAGPALQIASAVPEKSLPRLATGAALHVEPIDIAEADLAAAKANAQSSRRLTAPVAVGLALMFVAAGAVLFRRRFA